VGAVGVEISPLPLKRHIAYTTACCYRTSRDTESLLGFPLIPKHGTLNDHQLLFHVKFCFCACNSRTSFLGFRKQLRKNKYPVQIDPKWKQHTCKLGSLVSGNMRFMRISAGVLWKGSVKRQWGDALTHLLHFAAACILA